MFLIKNKTKHTHTSNTFTGITTHTQWQWHVTSITSFKSFYTIYGLVTEHFQNIILHYWKSHCTGNKTEWISQWWNTATGVRPGELQPLTLGNYFKNIVPRLSRSIGGYEWETHCINVHNLLFGNIVWFTTFTIRLMLLHKYIVLPLIFFTETLAETKEPPAWLHRECGLKAERKHERGKQGSFTLMVAPAIKHI